MTFGTIKSKLFSKMKDNIKKGREGGDLIPDTLKIIIKSRISVKILIPNSRENNDFIQNPKNFIGIPFLDKVNPKFLLNKNLFYSPKKG